jgi:hypothetical protein
MGEVADRLAEKIHARTPDERLEGKHSSSHCRRGHNTAAWFTQRPRWVTPPFAAL